MKGGSGDKFFSIDHLLLVTHAYIQKGAKEVTRKKESKLASMPGQLHCTNSHWSTQLHQSEDVREEDVRGEDVHGEGSPPQGGS